MTRLLITRHGETVWNVERKFQGWQDSPLTEKGIWQARCLAARLKNVEIDGIYASPSSRTVKTAEIIRGDRDLPIIPAEQLREIALGDWEGKVSDDAERECPDDFHAFWNSPHLFAGRPGGETYSQMQDRVTGFIVKLIEKHPGDTLLLVTHGAVIKGLLAFFQGKELARLWDPPFITQASLTEVIAGEEGYRVVTISDTSHFTEH